MACWGRRTRPVGSPRQQVPSWKKFATIRTERRHRARLLFQPSGVFRDLSGDLANRFRTPSIPLSRWALASEYRLPGADLHSYWAGCRVAATLWEGAFSSRGPAATPPRNPPWTPCSWMPSSIGLNLAAAPLAAGKIRGSRNLRPRFVSDFVRLPPPRTSKGT